MDSMVSPLRYAKQVFQPIPATGLSRRFPLIIMNLLMETSGNGLVALIIAIQIVAVYPDGSESYASDEDA
ncbi:MAG: hypothetical protein IPH88_04550 [Bacteroidales bacterium]|nr:hypothetical protein [Bacteroidales bacterium]